MPYGNLNVDTVTTSTAGGILGAGNASIMKNRILNGGMVIDQRNAGASVTIGAATETYTLDRWFGYGAAASKFSVQQNAGSVTAPVGFTNYLGVTSLAATTPASGDSYVVGQKIEGFNFSDVQWGTANAKTVTLSAWVYSSLTGTFGGSITNSAVNRCYPFTYTISSANTWTQISVTIAGDTTGSWVGATNGAGVRVYFGLGCGSSVSGTAGSWAGTAYTSATGSTSVVGTNGATFYITGVQLEVGSNATGFEYRQYGQELALCQRYYQSIASGLGISVHTVAFYDSTSIYGTYFYKVPMRTTPTLVQVSGTDYFRVYRNAGSDNFNFFGGIDNANTTQGEIWADSSGGVSGTAGQAGFVRTQNASASVAITAEL